MRELTKKQKRMVNKLDKHLTTYKMPKFYKIAHKRIEYYELIFGPLVPDNYKVIIQTDSNCYGIFCLDIEVFELATWNQIKSIARLYIKSVIGEIKEKTK